MIFAKTSYRPATESEIKFETYRGYLDAIRSYIYNVYGSWRNFGRQCIDHTKHIQGIGKFDEAWVKRFLKIAWNTEYILSSGGNDVDLIRINNQWSPIQAYYAVYACGEALAYVLDGSKADGHQKTLTKLVNFFAKSGLPPWNLLFEGNLGKVRQCHKPCNFTSGIVIPHNL